MKVRIENYPCFKIFCDGIEIHASNNNSREFSRDDLPRRVANEIASADDDHFKQWANDRSLTRMIVSDALLATILPQYLLDFPTYRGTEKSSFCLALLIIYHYIPF